MPVRTHSHVAHEAVHGPLEVPLSYIKGPCERLIPKDHPIRRVYCGWFVQWMKVWAKLKTHIRS